MPGFHSSSLFRNAGGFSSVASRFAPASVAGASAPAGGVTGRVGVDDLAPHAFDELRGGVPEANRRRALGHVRHVASVVPALARIEEDDVADLDAIALAPIDDDFARAGDRRHAQAGPHPRIPVLGGAGRREHEEAEASESGAVQRFLHLRRRNGSWFTPWQSAHFIPIGRYRVTTCSPIRALLWQASHESSR